MIGQDTNNALFWSNSAELENTSPKRWVFPIDLTITLLFLRSWLLRQSTKRNLLFLAKLKWELSLDTEYTSIEHQETISFVRSWWIPTAVFCMVCNLGSISKALLKTLKWFMESNTSLGDGTAVTAREFAWSWSCYNYVSNTNMNTVRFS